MARVPPELLQFVADESERIHHGVIRIEINADRPGRFDVVTERRERYHPTPGDSSAAGKGLGA